MKRTWILLFGLLFLAATAADGQFTYSTNGGAITLTKYTGSSGAVTISNFVKYIGATAFLGAPATNVTIPNGVVDIGNSAFFQSGLLNLSVPDSVTNIEAQAFMFCAGLTNVALGSNLVVVGDDSFFGCPGLRSVTFGPNLASIGEFAFSGYSIGDPLPAIALPNTLTNLASGAFEYCTGLTNVALGNHLIHLAGAFCGCSNLKNIVLPAGIVDLDGAFYDCVSLTNISIPNSVTSIGAQTFYGCASLSSVTISSSAANIGDYAFFVCTNLANVTVPNSVTNIGTAVFEGCLSLTNVMLGSHLVTIGGDAFYGCSALPSVTIPNSVTNIGDQAFTSCNELTNITVQPGNFFYSSVSGVLFNKSQSILIDCPVGIGGDYAIPAGVAAIGDEAFENCTSLATVTIPSSVTSIGAYSFDGCSGLKVIYFAGNAPKLSIPSSGYLYTFYLVPGVIYYRTSASGWSNSFGGVTTMGVSGVGFAGSFCYSLNSNDLSTATIVLYLGTNSDLAIPANVDNLAVTGIGNGKQQLSSAALTNVIIPNGVSTLGNSVFAGSKLINVTIPASVTNIGNWAFYECLDLASVVMLGGVQAIGTYAFNDCSALTNLVLPDGLATIGDFAFTGCAVSALELPVGLSSVGISAFGGCMSLTDVTVSSNLTSIGSAAFGGCQKLKAIDVDTNNPDFASVVGVLFDKSQRTLLQYPDGITGSSYTIPNGVTTIEVSAFGGCDALSSVAIPSTVTSLGNNAFAGTGLTSVAIPASVTNIGAYAFSGSALASVTVSNGVIGDFAFYLCRNLATAIVGDGVTSIGNGAFQYCPSLYSVTIGNGVTNIGEPSPDSNTGAFEYDTGLSLVTIGDGVTSIADFALDACSGDMQIYFHGNAPSLGNDVFAFSGGFVYYVPGATGWSTNFGGLATLLWNPQPPAITPFYSFNFGDFPYGYELTPMIAASGNTLFGASGVVGGGGTLFKITTNGTGYSDLHDFAPLAYNASGLQTNKDGMGPNSIILSGSTVYGSASAGGKSGYGTIFKISTSGGSFSVLYTFTNGADGNAPVCSAIAGNVLYGFATKGASFSLFSINVTGTGFTNFYTFQDGARLVANLAVSGTSLYGVTDNDGAFGAGTVYSFGLVGGGFTVLHTFTGSTNDGDDPGGILLSGNTLFGTTAGGGLSGGGTVFSINTNGSNFTLLHSFAGNDGSYPFRSIFLSSDRLYGSTFYGGISDSGVIDGTVFSVGTNGADFMTLYRFTASSEGSPIDEIVVGDTLFGSTANDDSWWSGGLLYKMSLDVQLPPLAIGPYPGNMILTWPNFIPGAALQSTTILGPTAIWSNVLPAPTVLDGLNTVTDTISGEQRFYRLSHPPTF